MTHTPNDALALIADSEREIATLTDHIERMKRHHAPFDLSKYESQLKRQKVALAALTAEPCGYHSEGAMQIDPLWPTPYGVGFRVEPKPNGIYNIPVYHAQPVQVLQPIERNAAKTSELAERAKNIVDDCNSLIRRINATEQPVSDGLYGIANHIAVAKNSLPQEWQNWAEKIESDLRNLAAAAGGR